MPKTLRSTNNTSSPRSWRFAAFLGGLLLAALIVTGCGQRATNIAVGDTEQILFVGNGTEPKGLDCHIVTGVPESNIMRALFQGLVSEHPVDLRPVPGVAERYQRAADGTVYTFHFRNDATWVRNGEVVDRVESGDFAFSYRRMLEPLLAAEYAYMLYPIRNAEAFHHNDFGALLYRYADDAPASWDSLSALPWHPGDAHDEDAETLVTDPADPAFVGLNLFDRDALLSLDVETFPRPEGVSVAALERVRQDLLDLRNREEADYYDFRAFLFEHVGVETPDARTLVIRLQYPVPYFLELLNHYSWWPVHPETILEFGNIDQRDSLWTRAGNITTNGPFGLAEWHLNRHVIVEKNPHYWGADVVRLQQIRFYPIDQKDTEERAFRFGYLHLTSSVPTHVIDKYRDESPDLLRFDTYLGTYYYRFNTEVEPFDDARVRRAIALAINREAIVEFVLRNAGQVPAYHFTPPGTGGFYANATLDSTTEGTQEARIAEAQRLLTEAGFPNGEGLPAIDLIYNTSEDHKKIAEAVQAMLLRDLGIEIGLLNQEWKVYLDTVRNGNYQMARAAWIGDYNDPNSFLDMWLTDGGNNQTGWSSEAYDELIAAAGREGDLLARKDIFHEAEQLLMDEQPIAPIYYYVRSLLIHPSVHGWYPTLLDNHPYQYVYLDPTRPFDPSPETFDEDLILTFEETEALLQQPALAGQ